MCIATLILMVLIVLVLNQVNKISEKMFKFKHIKIEKGSKISWDDFDKSFVRSFRSSLLASLFVYENENLILLSNRSVISKIENRATIRKENTNKC